MSDSQQDDTFHYILNRAATELDIPVQAVKDLICAEHLREVSLSTGRVVGGYFYTPRYAAELLSRDVYEIYLMIDEGELPRVQVDRRRWLPVQSVENLMHEDARRERNRSRTWPKADWVEFSDDRDVADSGALATEDSEGQDNRSTAESDADDNSGTPDSHELIVLVEDENQTLTEELERERTRRAKDLADAQHEIDQLDIQLENLRGTKDRAIEDLGADMEELELRARDLETELEQERKRREEAERTVRSLQRSRDGEDELLWGSERGDDGSEQHTPGSHNPVRGFLETFGKNVRDALGSEESTDRSGQWELAQLREELQSARKAHENDRSKAQYDYAQLENVYRDLDEQNRALKDEINDIKSSLSGLPTREELEVKLNWNEARRRDLEKSLALERQKIRNLESGARTLAEIRRLLGGDSPPAPEHTETTSSAAENDPDVSASDVLRVHTRHGEWVFRPPFALESDEVELIRLVAGEDEITAEQIKRRTGRQRAVKDLDYLLDRLHMEGLEPIKEFSDRYSFDPDFLQD